MNEKRVLAVAQRAFRRKEPTAFLSFLRKYRREYDSEYLCREFDKLERQAREATNA